jgi:hypothetical protein
MKFEVVDNFLQHEHYIKLLKVLEHLNPSITEKNVFNLADESVSRQDMAKELAQELEGYYLPKAMETLRRLAPHKEILVDYCKFDLQSTPPNYEYPIHLDGPGKVLSGVIYMAPRKSTGTFLHMNSKLSAFDEITWKENRAFFFSRTPNDSWHSYKGDGKNIRWVLIFNLMTNQLNKHEILDLGYFKFQYRRITDRIGKLFGGKSRYE